LARGRARPIKHTDGMSDVHEPLPGQERKKRENVTLADVAAVAGVSKMTASRALSSPELVSEEALQRVREAVARTGYIPNRIAGGLKSNRSGLIACIVPTIASGSAFLVAVHAMSKAFADAGYQVMLTERGYGALGEPELVESVIARRPEAIVLIGILQSPQARARLRGTGLPVVETWDMTSSPVDMLVGFSHEAVGASVARFFHERGCKHLAMIAADEPRGLQRAQGFINEARRLGLATDVHQGVPTWTVDAPTRMRQGREGLAQLLSRQPDIDALCCATDVIALGALTEAHARSIAVPQQLSIVGFGDLDFAADTEPALTTVRVDSMEIGRHAADMVLSVLDEQPVTDRVVDLGFEIVQRASA
jgi:LacI family gluconate utilization system Gnt-I transcriptional repressor